MARAAVALSETPTDVRGKALASATHLFATRGFDGTALQDVADAVGVSKPAILHHFSSKEALREAVLQELISSWTELLPKLLVAATSSHDRFDAVFGELHRFFIEKPERALVVLREGIDRPEETRKLLKGPVKPWLDAVGGYIRSGKEGGRHWSDVDVEAYVIVVLTTVITVTASAAVMSTVIPGPNSKARFEKELGRIARAALFTPEPPKAKKKRS